MNSPSDKPGLPPEQQDTARLLSELLGKAIAARYEDFCHLSMGVFALNVSKPMAAHALRELESMLRAVLAVPMEAVAMDGPEKDEKQKAVWKALKEFGYDDNVVTRALDALAPRTNHKDQIRRILTRLGFEPDGDIANLWIGIVDNHQVAHGRSFHRSMEIDADFTMRLQQPFDTIIRAVVVALRSHYAALMRRVRALVAMPDRSHAVKLFAKEIPGAMQLQWYFFRNLTTGDWLEPLMRQGLLGEPPRFTDEEGEGRLYGEWPAGDYLLRMAGSDDAPTRQRVIAALQAVAEADHPDILSGGIAILATLPPAEAAPLADLAVGWMRRDVRAPHTLARTELIKRLAETGEGTAALKVAREVFRLWGDDGRIKSHYGDHMYEHHLPLLRGTLATASGRGTLELLIDCLGQAVTIEGKSGYSHLSMHPVSHVNTPPFDIGDVLKTAVRETAEELVRDRTVTVSEVVGMLAANGEKIFVRLALHVLAQNPASAPALATGYLLKEELSTEGWCNPEYAALANAWFPSLLPEQQTAIIRGIDAVPGRYLDWWKARFEEQQHVPPSPEDVEKFTVNCTRDLLWRWRGVLPPDRREQIEKAGDPEAWRRSLETPDESPLTPADFSSKPVAEVIDFLRTWQPSREASRITLSALGQEVRAAATAQPETFSAVADRFAGLRPIYIRRLLEGLQQAAASRKPINWQSVLALIALTYSKASEVIDENARVDGEDPSWEWTCKAASELLMTGLRLGVPGIGVEHRSSVRSLIRDTLALVPVAVELEDFEVKFERHPYFTAQQTFRGIATELYVLLVRWQNLNAAPGDRRSRTAIRDDPEIARILEKQLTDRSPEGRIPRAIMGRYLRLLHYNDSEWIRSHVPVLLPANDSALREAAWCAHLMNDGGPVTDLMPELGPCYAEEIARLVGNAAHETERDFRQQRFAEYLMVLVLTGAAPQDLLAQFLQCAPAELRRRAMWFLGNQVSLPAKDLPDEMRRRGLAYWEMRLAAATSSSNPSDYSWELGVIDHWCFHGRIDELWLADQLLGMLAIGLVPGNGYHTVEWLAKLAVQHVDRAVEILLGLVQYADKSRWIYMTNQTPIRFILSEGRGRGSPETAGRVSRIVSHLASRGDASYLDLDLPKSDS